VFIYFRLESAMTQPSRTAPRARALAGLSAGALVASLGITFLGAGVSSAAPPAPQTTTFDAICTGGGFVSDTTLKVSVTATPPASPVAGAANQVTGFSTTITLPAGTVENLNGAGVTQLAATQTAALTTSNGSITPPGLVIPPTTVPPSGTLALTTNSVNTAVNLPNSGTTAISIGELVTNLTLRGADGKPKAGFDNPTILTCAPPTNTKILSFDVAQGITYTVNGTATPPSGTPTAFGPGSLAATVTGSAFSGTLTLPDINIRDYRLFGVIPTSVQAKVVPTGPVTGTIATTTTTSRLTASSTVDLQIDQISVFGLPLLTPGSMCKTVAPSTVTVNGPFTVATGGTLNGGTYTAANFSGCGLFGFFIEPLLNANVSGIPNAISATLTPAK